MNTKYQISSVENKRFLKEIREGLLNFGHDFPSPGGGSDYLGDDGIPWKDRSRETWIASRMAHVYSIGFFLGHEGSEELHDGKHPGFPGLHHGIRRIRYGKNPSFLQKSPGQALDGVYQRQR